MAIYIHDKNPNSEKIRKQLRGTPTCPGTCIFFDLVNSTKAKYDNPVEIWGSQISNTFNFLSFLNDFPENIVKGIGDEIMIYISDTDLKKKSGYNTYFALIEEIVATIDNIKHFPIEGLFIHCKTVIHYCTDVYNITFLKGQNDYYGRDIDMTARLMSKSQPNRIVISEKYYQMVQKDLEQLGQPFDYGSMSVVSEEMKADFKGVPHQTGYRFIDI